MSDKIIQFPGSKIKNPGVTAGPVQPEGALAPPNTAKDVVQIRGPEGDVPLTEQQQKAIHCILSGLSFVFVGIRDTDGGADFFRAIHGSDASLRNALPHIHDQVDKAYYTKGLLRAARTTRSLPPGGIGCSCCSSALFWRAGVPSRS